MTSEKRAQKFHTDIAGTSQIWIVLLIGWSKFWANQKHYPDLGSDTSSVWNFWARSSDVISQENRWKLFSQELMAPKYAQKIACVEGTSRYYEFVSTSFIETPFLVPFPVCLFTLPRRRDHLNRLLFWVFKQRFYSYKLDDVDLLRGYHTLKNNCWCGV